MARYIDAYRLKRVFHRNIANGEVFDDLIDNAPTADVQPVKHGHWVNCKAGFYHSFGECSECGHFTTMKHNYCPNCGAKMVE